MMKKQINEKNQSLGADPRSSSGGHGRRHGCRPFHGSRGNRRRGLRPEAIRVLVVVEGIKAMKIWRFFVSDDFSQIPSVIRALK